MDSNNSLVIILTLIVLCLLGLLYLNIEDQEPIVIFTSAPISPSSMMKTFSVRIPSAEDSEYIGKRIVPSYGSYSIPKMRTDYYDQYYDQEHYDYYSDWTDYSYAERMRGEYEYYYEYPDGYGYEYSHQNDNSWDSGYLDYHSGERIYP